MKERIAMTIGGFILTFFNLVLGIPLSLTATILILTVCFIDIILLLAPVFLILSFFIQGIHIGLGPNNIVIQCASVVVCVVLGYYLKEVLEIYVPKYFELLRLYYKASFKF